MPWNVKRVGEALEVHITAPVGSWRTLSDVVERHVESGLTGAVVPEHLPGAPLIDDVFLQRFRDELTARGIELLTPAFA
jgi:hypothetical protein